MTPSELESIARDAYGWGWQTALAAELGIHTTTMNRDATGKMTIPRTVEYAVRFACLRKKAANTEP